MICQQCGKGIWACDCNMDAPFDNSLLRQRMREIMAADSLKFEEALQGFMMSGAMLNELSLVQQQGQTIRVW